MTKPSTRERMDSIISSLPEGKEFTTLDIFQWVRDSGIRDAPSSRSLGKWLKCCNSVERMERNTRSRGLTVYRKVEA